MIMNLRLKESSKTILFVLLCIVSLDVSLIAGGSSVRAEESAALAVTITGRVTDTDGVPLAGATIQVKGTTQGTVTDAEGNFRISVPEDATLIVSFVGYITQEVLVGNLTEINVMLEADVAELGEVVVVGYGTQRKSDLTGAISSIRPAEITAMPTQRVDQALQGRTTGVFVMNTDGSPGGNTIIRIRGLNSIQGGNEPLVVVDGLQGADIDQINPNDIASMEILKDASATAIYGSRGANGVILITTKLGRIGKPVIDASYSVGIQKLAKKLPTMSAAEFAKYNNYMQSFGTAGGATPHYYFTDEDIARYERDGGTDWQDEVYGTGVMQNANLAISGATNRLKYMVSSSYLDHEGIMLNSKYTRLSLRANLAADITDWVDFGLNYSYTKETYKSPPFSEGDALFQVVNNAVRWAPTEPVYDENGNYWRHTPGYAAYDTWNPVATALETKIENPIYTNNANLFLNFKIIKGLSFKVMGGASFYNYYNSNYQNTKTRNGYAMNGVGTVDESVSNRLQNTNILTYDNIFGAHHITFTGVFEGIFNKANGSGMRGQDFLVDQLSFDNMDGAKSVSVDTWRSERTLISWMGRINYSLKDRYLVTFSYRADASSVFGKDNKWGYFPSGSVAWRVSEEEFLKNIELINDLKLRVSYGVTGNQGISPYGSLARLGSGEWYRYPYNNGDNLNIGFGISDIANPGLKWESTAQTDVGMDLSLFKGRFTTTIDWYKKVTEDLLMNRQLPGYVGVSSVLDNIGSIENKGLEIMLGGDPLVGKLRWNTSINITINRNKVLDLGPGVTRLGYRPTSGGYSLGDDFMFLEVGQPFGLMRGWRWEGLWRADQEDEARSYGQLPGWDHLADISGPDGVPDGQVDTFDKTIIGNGYPKYTWGFSNLFTYRGIELSFLIIGSKGNDLFNTVRIRRQSEWEGVDPILWDEWTPQNQGTSIQKLYDGAWLETQDLENKYYTNGYQTISKWVEDASFVRLKTITLGYNIEQRLLKKIGFTKAKVYFTGTNLLTITDYTGYDPEIAAYPSNDATIGVDLSVYPPAKTYTFGVEFTF